MSNRSPASQAEATNALKALFTAFPAERGNGMGAAATYLMAVEGYSLEAITKAVKRLIRGEFEWFGGRFLPTPAELSRACRYCEDLVAPVALPALPAPGDEALTAAELERRAKQAQAARERFGIKTARGEIITDREAVPAARLAKLDAAVEQAAAKLKSGNYRLSPEALATFDKDQLDRAVDDPGTAYTQWQKERAA